MTIIAVIPCRAGSKGIAGKNRRDMLGKPLFMWSVDQALEAGCFDKIVVATDDDEIEAMLENTPYSDIVEAFPRHPWTATDKACTEAVLLQVILAYNPSHVCLLQATSPLRPVKFIQIAMSRLAATEATVSVVPDYHVRLDEPRKMRQLMSNYVENGSIYAFRVDAFMRNLDRRCNVPLPIEMPDWTRYEIDTEDDWTIVEAMMRTHLLGDTPDV